MNKASAWFFDRVSICHFLSVYSWPLVAKNPKGLTFVEVMFSLVIIVGVTFTSLSFVNKRENHIKKTFRHFTALNRRLDYQARLQGQRWRLVINLDKNTYWVEKQEAFHPQESGFHFPESSSTTSKKEDDSKRSPDGFVQDTNFFEKPQTLPKKFSFESLESSYQYSPLKSGLAYIYYLPEGQFSTALVLIKYKNSYRSLFFNRLTGDMTLFSSKKNLKDLKQ